MQADKKKRTSIKTERNRQTQAAIQTDRQGQTQARDLFPGIVRQACRNTKQQTDIRGTCRQTYRGTCRQTYRGICRQTYRGTCRQTNTETLTEVDEAKAKDC